MISSLIYPAGFLMFYFIYLYFLSFIYSQYIIFPPYLLFQDKIIMMVPSNIIIFQLSISVLLLITFTMTTNIPQATESEISQSYDDEVNNTIFKIII